MVFSTPLFLCFFLPVSLGLYFVAPKWLRLVVLTLLSYVFYAWSGPWFLLLLVWTTLVDYIAGGLIAGDFGRPLSARARRVTLGVSLTNTIGLLALFKYGQLVATSIGFNEILTHIALPAGISFYTFESISYVLDIYHHGQLSAAHPYLERAGPGASRWRRLAAHGRGLIAFACYIAQFPHLVAGPIIRFRELQFQLLRPRTGANRFARGTIRFCIGLGKKVLIADTLAQACDAIFPLGSLHAGYVWCGAVAFALQIYFDFSGYSDMAIGLAQMLGFRFPENFDSPYKSVSLTEFWRRWHMTLSRWLRDYIYIPLGGNRRGEARTVVNLFVTMLIAGLWHGAGWGFVVWGGLHGLVLAIERLTMRRTGPRSSVVMGLHRAATLLFLVVSWIVFRNASLSDTMVMLFTMVNPFSLHFEPGSHAAVTHWSFPTAMAAGVAFVFLGRPAQAFCKRVNLWTTSFALLIFVASLLLVLLRTSVPFLYFKF